MNYVKTQSGIIISEADFRESNTAVAARNIFGEVATTVDGRDITRGFIDQMPLLAPQDSVLQRRGGGNYEIYDEILRDDQVHATLDQLFGVVTSAEVDVQPGGKKKADIAAAAMIEEYLEGVNSSETALEKQRAVAPLSGFDQVIHSMMYGKFYGHAVAENMWSKDGRFIALDGLKVRKARRFGFSTKSELKLITSNNPEGEFLPSRKFWSYTVHSDNTDDPYGLGLAHWLYWPVFFKRNGLKFWLMFLEKFGQPTAIGTYPGNATDPEKQKLLGALRAITTDSGIIMPQGMEMSLLEATRSGTADYSALYKTMNEMISKVVLGQYGTTESTPGKLGNDDSSQDTLKANAKSVSDMVHDSFNRTTVAWLTKWNYPNAKVPKVTRVLEDKDDLNTTADRDTKIFQMGYEPSEKYINDTYGGEWVKKASTLDDTKLPATPKKENETKNKVELEISEFAETLDTTVDELSKQLFELSEESVSVWLGNIKTLLEKSEDLSDFSNQLQSNNKHLPPEELTTLMQYALAVADLRGRSEVQDETGTDDNAEFAQLKKNSLVSKIHLAFKNAVDFFRGKTNLPTSTWHDIWESMHDHSFVVAGAMSEDLLSDLRKEVDRAISEGTGIKLFRENFDKIVAKHGWSYNGGQAWRTRIIFETNINSAYQAGRYKQLQELKETHQYWLYRHSDHVAKPRPKHVSWDGLILRADDKWWDTHYPPNGWGCQCRVFALNERQMKARQKKAGKKEQVDITPAMDWESQTVGKHSDNPKSVMVPDGIDAGFAYAPGKSSWQKHKKELGL